MPLLHNSPGHLHVPSPANPHHYRAKSNLLTASPCASEFTPDLFNNQFHSGLRRNETSGFDDLLLIPFLPPGKGARPFPGRLAEKKVLHADIFIHLRPVNPMSSSDELPYVPMSRLRVRKTGIPGERDAYLSAVRKPDTQCIFADRDASCSRASGQCRSSHSRSQSIEFHSLP